MKATDCRSETWESIRRRLSGDRQRVYEHLLRFGPCTTRQMATDCMGLSLLTIRPRVSELVSLGLARCVGRKHNRASEGIYQAVPLEEARRVHDRPFAAGGACQGVLF